MPPKVGDTVYFKAAEITELLAAIVVVVAEYDNTGMTVGLYIFPNGNDDLKVDRPFYEYDVEYSVDSLPNTWRERT